MLNSKLSLKLKTQEQDGTEWFRTPSWLKLRELVESRNINTCDGG
jgi:hypothetical protein